MYLRKVHKKIYLITFHIVHTSAKLPWLRCVVIQLEFSVFHWGSVFVTVYDMCVCLCVCVCVHMTKYVWERRSMCDRTRKRRDKVGGRGKQRKLRGDIPVGLWVTQSTQWGDRDWQTGDLTFPWMLFMALIMDLMLPWRPSIPARKNSALIFKESLDAAVCVSGVSGKAHMTCLGTYECTIVNSHYACYH